MKETTTDNFPDVTGKHSRTLLAMDGKNNHHGNEADRSVEHEARKLLYKVDEVPPPGILLSVAFQVGFAK